MIEKAEKELLKKSLEQWSEGAELSDNVERLIQKHLRTNQDEMLDLFDVVPMGEDKDGLRNPIVCCCFSYSNLRCRWVRRDVCAKFGAEAKDDDCGAQL